MKRLFLDICEVCGCYPSYISIAMKMKPSNCTRKCNFFRHATCAARMINNRDWLTNGCVPACNSYSFQQSSIQVQYIIDTFFGASLYNLLIRFFSTLFYYIIFSRLISRLFCNLNSRC